MTPLGVLGVLGVTATVIGTSRRLSRATMSPRRWRQSACAILGCLLMWWASSSSFADSAMRSLPRHMVAHVVIMFLVPIALVYGAIGRQVLWAFPVTTRRRLLRVVRHRPRRSRRRAAIGALAATITMNAVMVLAHVPSVFIHTMTSSWLMDWVMDPAFVLSGFWFFSYLVVGAPRRLLTPIRVQVAVVLLTTGVMLVLAMSMSIFARDPWYAALAGSIPGDGYTKGAQGLAAGILWICGDFWAVPLLIVIVRRVVVRDGSLLGSIEAQLSRSTSA